MASAASNKCKYLLWKKVIDGVNDTFKIALMNTDFSFDKDNHHSYSDVSANEVASGSGYTTGGNTLTGNTVTENDTQDAGILSFNNTTWTMSGADLETVGAIIYDDTLSSPTADPIIAFIDFGGTLVTYDGGTFTIANIAVAAT